MVLSLSPGETPIDESSRGNRLLFDHDGFVAWMASVPDSNAKYLAVLNTRDLRVRDLWTHEDLGTVHHSFAPIVNWHGARLFRLTPS